MNDTSGKSRREKEAGREARKPEDRPARVMASLETGSKSILNITNLAIIAILIGLILFVVKIAAVFGIFLFSFVIAFLLFPMVEWLADRRIPRVWAILIVYVFIGGILFGVGAAIVPAIIAQGNDLFDRLPDFANNLKEALVPKLQIFWAKLQEKGVTEEDIQKYLGNVIPTVQGWAVFIGQKIATGVQGAVGSIVSAITVPIIVFYLLLDAPKIRLSLMKFAPKRAASEIQNLLNRLSEMLGHYLRGQLKLSGLMFFLTSVFLWALGVKHWLLLGALAGVTEVIPIIGPIIAFVPAVLVGFFQPSDSGVLQYVEAGWARALVITGFYMLLQYTENNFMVPRIMGKNLNLHPLTVMFSLLAGGYLAGIFGMLLSLPIAASLKVVFEMYYPEFIQRVEDLVSRRPYPGDEK
jgi:predicted PurR-regulated permease PerM